MERSEADRAPNRTKVWARTSRALRWAIAVCLLISVAGVQPRSARAVSRDASTFCADAEELAFLTLINDYRAQNGLGALILTQTLGAAADFHSVDMATKNYFAHDLLDGTSWSQNMTDFGYGYSTWRGENIAAGNSTAAATFTQWKNSPGHNANMLSANFHAIGIGRAYNASATYDWYWTTDFGGYVDAAATCGAPAPTPTKTAIPVPTATKTPTPVPTATKTATPVPTATKTATPVPTATKTPTPVPTATKTPTPVPTATKTATPVPTATKTATPVPPTAVPTNTPVPTATRTPTPRPANTATPKPTRTPRSTATSTPKPVVYAHVAQVVGKGATSSGVRTLTVTVTIKATTGAAVSGARVTVTVRAPNGVVQRITGTTNSQGQVALKTTLTGGAGRYVAAVAGVSASGKVYDANRNVMRSVTVTLR